MLQNLKGMPCSVPRCGWAIGAVKVRCPDLSVAANHVLRCSLLERSCNKYREKHCET
jgi:hypothetical protein